MDGKTDSKNLKYIGNVAYREFTAEERVQEDKENDDLAKDLDALLTVEMSTVKKQQKQEDELPDDDLLLDLDKLNEQEKEQKD